MSLFSSIPRRGLLAGGAAILAALCAVIATPSAAPSAPAAPPAHSDPRCVFGLSKDVCDGLFCCGTPKYLNCTRDGVECRTVIVRDNVFKFQMRQSPGTCADPTYPEVGRCDEAEKLDGTVSVRGDFTLRLNQPCRFRGCWGGEFKLETEEGVVGGGTASGTLGGGSHRSPTCLSNFPCGEDCEACYGVEFIPDPNGLTGTWRIDLEGVLDGAITAGAFESSELCATIQGHLTTPGTVNGPSDITEWKFCGTTDGVVLSKCQP